MEIITFDNDQSPAGDFVDFLYRLYSGDPRFICPPRSEQFQFVTAAGPLYSESDIKARHFLAVNGTRVVGRLSAFINPHLQDQTQTPVGLIGLFECQDDAGTSASLFSAAAKWLNQNYCAHTIYGPMNGSIWRGYRLMTRGFDQDPFVGEPYNKPYYADLFARYGFTVRQEWDSVEIDDTDTIRRMIARGKDRYDLLRSRGYRFESWSRLNGESQIRSLYQILCESYRGFLGFTPISFAQFALIFERMRPALDPDLFILAYAPDDACAGFAVAFPDLAHSVRSMHGETGLGARFRFFLHRHEDQRLNFYIGGIAPNQEENATGLGRAGFYFVINRALDKGYTNLLLTLRLKGNKAHGLAARSGVAPQREYALYEYRYAT